jgi:hypothetical protein
MGRISTLARKLHTIFIMFPNKWVKYKYMKAERQRERGTEKAERGARLALEMP